MSIDVETVGPTRGRRLWRAVGALLIAAALTVPGTIARADHDTRVGRDDAGASTAEAHYVATLEAEIEVLAVSVDRFNALLDAPNLGDPASIDDLTEILTTWVAAFETAQSLTPPPAFAEVHSAYLDFTAFLAAAAPDIAAADVGSAIAKLEQAQEQLAVLVKLVEDVAGRELLDKPSG